MVQERDKKTIAVLKGCQKKKKEEEEKKLKQSWLPTFWREKNRNVQKTKKNVFLNQTVQNKVQIFEADHFSSKQYVRILGVRW